MIIHVLPLGAFLANYAVAIASYRGSKHRLRPIDSSGGDERINLDGFVTFTGDQDRASRAYTQVFRTGVVEAVSVLYTDEGRMNLPSVAYEEDVMEVLRSYYSFAEEFDIDPPYYLFLSFVGVRGCNFVVGRRWMSEEAVVLRQETLILPEIVIESRDDPSHQVLRPTFDMVWNAFGFAASSNYDDQGNWVGR